MASLAPAAPSTDRRVRYSREVKEAIAARYPHCRSTTDKLALCADLRILDEDGQPDLNRLYNLASRLKATSVASNEDNRLAARAAALDPSRLAEREDPRGTRFSAENDRYLATWFGRQEIEIIAMQIGHTEIATAYRARVLGLRRAVRHWELRHVLAWLGMDRATFDAELGVPVLECCDRYARVKIRLVDSAALTRRLVTGGCWQRLRAKGQLEGREMDMFFIHELIESAVSQRNGIESDALWVSHGHICLNPLAPLSFGHFYGGDDPRIAAVCELTPEQISPNQVYHHRWIAESRRLAS